MNIIGKLIEMKLERDVKKARKKFVKSLKSLREGRTDLSKVPIPDITGEIRGSSEKGGDKAG